MTTPTELASAVGLIRNMLCVPGYATAIRDEIQVVLAALAAEQERVGELEKVTEASLDELEDLFIFARRQCEYEGDEKEAMRIIHEGRTVLAARAKGEDHGE